MGRRREAVCVERVVAAEAGALGREAGRVRPQRRPRGRRLLEQGCRALQRYATDRARGAPQVTGHGPQAALARREGHAGDGEGRLGADDVEIRGEEPVRVDSAQRRRKETARQRAYVRGTRVRESTATETNRRGTENEYCFSMCSVEK